VADRLGPWIAPNLERRSRLRHLDDLLEALESLNLQDGRTPATITAELSAMQVILRR
jgi:hypothetical protein